MKLSHAVHDPLTQLSIVHVKFQTNEEIHNLLQSNAWAVHHIGVYHAPVKLMHEACKTSRGEYAQALNLTESQPE